MRHDRGNARHHARHAFLGLLPSLVSRGACCVLQVLARMALLPLCALCALAPSLSPAQVRYYYDELGRLVEAVAPDGSSAQYTYDPRGNITDIKKLAAATVSIAEFTPNGGPVGTVVTLYGTGFNATAASNTVKFNGTTATVTAATATSLTVTVPASATTGTISVANSAGSATSATAFVVGVTNPVPTITGFNPQVGVMGTAVTVTGTHFQLAAEDNKVTLGTMSAAVVQEAGNPTATQLKLAVPSAGASGKVSITTPYGKAASTSDFYALPATLNPADVEFKGRLVVDGAAVNVTTTAPGKKAVLLFDGTGSQALHLVTTSSTFATAPTATVYAPDGSQIETLQLVNSWSADFTRQLRGAATTATYTVVIAPQPTEKGSMNLSVVADVSGALTIDAPNPTPVTLARAGQSARYTFSGTAGQLVSVVLGAVALDDSNPATNNPITFLLFKPNDLSTSIASLPPLYGGAGATLNALLPESGTYTLLVSPGGLDKGSFSLHAKSYATGTLAVDGSTAINLSAGRTGRYGFAAPAGKGHGLALTGLSSTPAGSSLTVTLRNPSGGALRTCTFYNSDSCDFPPGDFTVAGNYLIDFEPGTASAVAFNAVLSKDAGGALAVDAATATPVTIAREGQNARHTFSGAAGQKVDVVIDANTLGDGDAATNNSTPILLYKPSDPNTPVASTYLTAGATGITLSATLPESGTYTVLVNPIGLDKGGFTLQAKSYATGTLAVDGATAINLSAGRTGRYTFAAEAGKGYGLAMKGMSFTPANGSLTATLRKSDETQLAQCSASSGGASCDFAPSLFAAAGNYIIDFAPAAAHAVAFNAVLSKDAGGVLTVDAATPTTVTIAREGQNGRYTFSGTAGQTISVLVSGNTMDDGNASTANATLVSLSKPGTGAEIASQNLPAGAATGFIDATLPDTGTYTLFISPSGLDKGSLGIQVKSTATGTLAVDASTPINLSAGRNGRYSFAAEAGKGYGLAATGLSFTPAGASLTVTLRKPDTTPLKTCTFSASDSCDFDATLFAAAGNYLVDFDPTGTSAVVFNAVLSKDTGGVITVDAATATTVAIAREGQNGRYTFSGTNGQSISVLIAGNVLDDGNAGTVNNTVVSLLKPSNASTIAFRSIPTGTASDLIDITLTETGTHTLLVNPAGLDKGSIGLQVKSTATGTLAVDASTPINLGAGRNGRYSFAAEAGKGYGLAVTGLTLTPAGTLLTVTLRNPGGTALRTCTFNNSDSCDFPPSDFVAAGNYLVDFDPSGAAAAVFNAVLSKDAVGSVAIDAATAAPVTIAREGQNGRYTFSGTAGQQVSVVVSGNTLDDGSAGTTNYTTITLHKPSDASAFGDLLSIPTGTAGNVLDARLPETGVYTLYLNPTGLDKGSIGIQVKSTATGTLTLGSATAIDLGAGRNGRYGFTAEAGKAYRLNWTGLSFTPTGGTLGISLRRPDGSGGTSCLVSASTGGCAFIAADFPTAGTYQIEFDALGLNAVALTVTLSKDATNTLAVDGSTPINLTTGSNNRYSFAAEAGKGYALAVTGTTFTPDDGSSSLLVTLKAADGSILMYCPSELRENGTCLFPPSYFTAAGTYNIDFSLFHTTAVTFNATLNKDLTGTLTLDAASPTVVNFTRQGQNARYTFSGTAGQLVNLVLSGNTLGDGNPNTNSDARYFLYKPSDAQTPFKDGWLYSGMSGTSMGASLPEAGVYTLRLAPAVVDTGSVGLQVKSYATGNLAMDGSTAISLSVGQRARYSFTAQAGKGYGLALTGLTALPTNEVVMIVRLLKADGSPIRTCSLTTDDSCDFSPIDFPTAGSYFIDFEPGDAAVTFNALLSNDAAGTLTAGAATATTVTTARVGQNIRYTFTATAGQPFDLVFSGNTMDDANPATANKTQIELYSPMFGHAFPYLSSNLAPGSAGSIFNVTSPETGTYTVYVNPRGLDKGSIGLKVIKK